jgi:hypothetical protein
MPEQSYCPRRQEAATIKAALRAELQGPRWAIRVDFAMSGTRRAATSSQQTTLRSLNSRQSGYGCASMTSSTP